MTQERNDPHRPGAIVPTDYVFVDAVSFRVDEDFMAIDPDGLNLIDRLRDAGVLAQVHSGANDWLRAAHGQCDICGAAFLDGCIWRHIPTGQHIIIGHICGDNVRLVADAVAQGKLNGFREEHAARKARRLRHREMRARIREALKAFPSLYADLRAAKDHYIVRDIRARFIQYGTISPKQAALVAKLAVEARNAPPAQVFDAPVPSGRQDVTGTILGVKEVEGYLMGDTAWKMLVAVTTPAGDAFKVYGTLPASIPGSPSELRGRRVSFRATLRPREPGFGFFSRPSKGILLDQEASEGGSTQAS